MSRVRILFLVKCRETYSGTYSCFGTGGLFYSAHFVVLMLVAAGIEAKLVQVIDNNDIDREVSQYRPSHVFLEALWVVPEKFAVLIPLHPNVKWIIRIHSEVPFLSYEGVAFGWIAEYVHFRNVFVAANSAYAARDLQSFVAEANPHWSEDRVQEKVLYLPNYYLANGDGRTKVPNDVLDIGCFGAMRPLKNQLIQALAAVEYAGLKKKPLRFHINTRIEQEGEGTLKNIRSLMRETGNELVEHAWQTHEDFLTILARTEIGMQVSFSETFDIVAADTVNLGIPLVTSEEVTWASGYSQASTTNTASILAKLQKVTGTWKNWIAARNFNRLRAFSAESRNIWLVFGRDISINRWP